jgi:YD repeat-containing protein
MTEAADPDMTERFSYNGAGRLKEVHYVDAGKRVRYSFTARGRVRQVINPAGNVLQYERDAVGRLPVIAWAGSQSVSLAPPSIVTATVLLCV